jgi:hypothetical protein
MVSVIILFKLLERRWEDTAFIIPHCVMRCDPFIDLTSEADH